MVFYTLSDPDLAASMSGLKKFWSDSGLDKEEKFLKVSTALYKTELRIVIGIFGYLISNLGVGPKKSATATKSFVTIGHIPCLLLIKVHCRNISAWFMIIYSCKCFLYHSDCSECHYGLGTF
jgi:hypothetical protein